MEGCQVKLHEVELVRRIYDRLASGIDDRIVLRGEPRRTPHLMTIERTVHAMIMVLGIPIAPDGTIEYEAPRADDRRVLELAREIGRHWRDQEGVNAHLLDELAEATRSA
jgi:hypothetical protein